MSILLCAGVGDLNGRVAKLWQEKQETVIGFRKRLHDESLTFEQHTIDLSRETWPDVMADYIVIALSARERSVESYRQTYELPIKQLTESMANWKALPKKIIVVSSTRVYGEDNGADIDDECVASTNDEYGHILLNMERLVNQLPCDSTVVRLSGIYGPGRGWLKRTALTASLETLPRNHWTNRIHIDDAAAAIVYLLGQDKLAPSYIVTDLKPQPLVTMYNYFRQQQELSPLLPMPEVTGGKRLIPSRLQATGFVWQYPDAFSGGYDV